MSRQGWRAATAVLMIAAIGGATASAATAAGRPDLSIARGSVQVSGGQIRGTFVVDDHGPGAGRVGVTLSVAGAVQRRYVVRLPADGKVTVRVAVPVPAGLAAGTVRVRVCADPRRRVRERSERNNCRTLGTVTTAPAPSSAPSTSAPGSPPPSAPATPDPGAPTGAAPSAGGGAVGGGGGGVPEPATSGSSVPTAPVAFTPNQSFALGTYWIVVPSAYDATHATPTQLLVWLHGCGGEGRYDIENVAPAAADPYIAIAVGGREGACWDVDGDQAKVLAAIIDVETHFNIDKRRIVLAGYSSGGDLSYRTAFYHARVFAGVLAANTSPFRDTGSSASASIAAAAWRFPVVQLAHTGDDTYPIATVRSETSTLRDAGFPVTLVERPGGHYDDPGAGRPGTDADIRTYLLPHLRDGWTSPPG